MEKRTFRLFNLSTFKPFCCLLLTTYCLSLIGCKKKTIAGDETRLITLSLAADNMTLPADGSSTTTITATVKYEDNDTPASELTVEFHATQGTITDTAVTNSNGIATATLTSGTTTGKSTVSAYCKNIYKTTDIEFFLSEDSLKIFSLNADPQSIPADGESQSIITAVVVDTLDVPAPNVPIIFTTNLGTITQSDTTDSTGTATAILTSSTTGGISTVTAAYSATVKDSVNVTFTTEGGEVKISSLNANPQTIPADGMSTSLITAVIRYLDESPAPNLRINFSISPPDLGQITPSDTTDATGTATAILTSNTTPGVATVIAAYDATVKDSVEVTLTAMGDTVPASIILYSIDHTSIYVKGVGYNETSTLIFQVRDASGNPVDGTHQVDFAIQGGPDGGEYLDPDSATTDTLSLVTTHLNSGTKSGPVKIVATVHGTGISSSQTSVTILSGPPHPEHFTIATDKLNLYALGIAGVEDLITAFVGDTYGNPVPDSTTIWFSTQCGIIRPGSGITSGGTASNTLISCAPWPTWPPEGFFQVYGETRDGSGNTIRDSVRVLWSGDAILDLSWSTEPNDFNIPNGGSENFTITLRDVYGNPLSGGTTMKVDATVGDLEGDININIPDTQDTTGTWTNFSFKLYDDEPDTIDTRRSAVTVTVIGNGNATAAAYGTID